MLPIIMCREFIARSTKMLRSIGRLSASALSHHDLSLAVFISGITAIAYFDRALNDGIVPNVARFMERSDVETLSEDGRFMVRWFIGRADRGSESV
jgi:hypothetical protein